MKKTLFTTLLLSFVITGCNRPDEQTTSEPTKDLTITAQFEQSDDKINKFLDQLDDPNIVQNARIQILCKDYPTEYKTNYIPALLKLSPAEYTETKLLKDLDVALNYYKEKDNIHC